MNGELMKQNKKQIYLDYAATTPVDSRVLKAMQPYFSEKFGNPGSLHSFGQVGIKAVDEAREKIAKAIGVQFREIIFTGSATEANNLALRGLVSRIKNQGLKDFQPRVITSAIEHESVLEICRDLEKQGVEVIYLPVNKQGVVDLKKLKESLNGQTVLVSIMYVNNEIGTVQPISEISQLILEFRKKNLELSGKNTNSYILNPAFYPLFHVDAVQALQFLDCNVNNLGVDLMTLSAHKVYGPKGVGVLYVREQRARGKERILGSDFIAPIITGGGQEYGLRSGTENVPLIVGMAEAVDLVLKEKEKSSLKISGLRHYLWSGIRSIYRKAEINGVLTKDKRKKVESGQDTLPNILNVYFPAFLAEELLVMLDINGVAVSAGSACSARSNQPSYVISALGYSKERAKRSLRFSFGKQTTRGEVDKVLKILKNKIT